MDIKVKNSGKWQIRNNHMRQQGLHDGALIDSWSINWDADTQRHICLPISEVTQYCIIVSKLN